MKGESPRIDNINGKILILVVEVISESLFDLIHGLSTLVFSRTYNIKNVYRIFKSKRSEHIELLSFCYSE